uniref:Transcription and mRNA export factor ENY2 n=1 Tax=Aegilops tauschii subsp. strangulata TaxID=200361 RepID=A0A453GBZ4_AEGTS
RLPPPPLPPRRSKSAVADRLEVGFWFLKLVESGEKERLMELLRERLVECGWRDDMKALCRAYARKKGRNNVTLDDLIHVITPKGRASVPDAVKAELLQRIRSFLMSSSLW